MKNPSNEDGRREGRPDAPHGVLSDGQGSAANDLQVHFLSRTDFEAALPLYVGGELDSDECARVDSWLNEHPEDRDLLEAASVSRSLLQEHAGSLRSAPCPDLWAGIRGELAEAGLFASSAPSPTHSSLPGGAAHGDERQSVRPLRSVRWYERRSLAAAAAVLIFGGLGAMMWSGGERALPGPDASPNGVAPGYAMGATPAVAAPAVMAGDSGLAAEVFTGTESDPAGVRLAGTKRGVRLRQVTGPADHILDNAVPVRIEQAQFPNLSLDPRSGEQVQLTGGR